MFRQIASKGNVEIIDQSIPDPSTTEEEATNKETADAKTKEEAEEKNNNGDGGADADAGAEERNVFVGEVVDDVPATRGCPFHASQ